MPTGGKNDTVNSVAIIGAGPVGRGIAYLSALGGFETTLEDIRPQALEQAICWVRRRLDEGVERREITSEEARQGLARMRTAGRVEEAADADLVIEAGPEDMELKTELFGMLDKFARAETILATSSSLLSTAEMAAVTQRPERCLSMHFPEPVPETKLIELVRVPETSEETLGACREVAGRMGKDAVTLDESPGLVASRISALVANEAFAMLEAGTASAEDIDKVLKLGLDLRAGPLELADTVGLDARLELLEHLERALGEKYRPSPLLRQYVREGRLGRKTGRGVYEYGKEKTKS